MLALSSTVRTIPSGGRGCKLRSTSSFKHKVGWLVWWVGAWFLVGTGERAGGTTPLIDVLISLSSPPLHLICLSADGKVSIIEAANQIVYHESHLIQGWEEGKRPPDAPVSSPPTKKANSIQENGRRLTPEEKQRRRARMLHVFYDESNEDNRRCILSVQAESPLHVPFIHSCAPVPIPSDS